MESGAGSVVSFAFVEFLAECADVFTTLVVGPAVYGRRRFSPLINAHQAVPEGTRRDVGDLGVLSLLEYAIDRSHDLSERCIGIDLGSP